MPGLRSLSFVEESVGHPNPDAHLGKSGDKIEIPPTVLDGHRAGIASALCDDARVILGVPGSRAGKRLKLAVREWRKGVGSIHCREANRPPGRVKRRSRKIRVKTR